MTKKQIREMERWSKSAFTSLREEEPTPRQWQMLHVVRGLRAVLGRAPLQHEVAVALDCSPGNVQALCRGLRRRGYVRGVEYGVHLLEAP